jgi:phage terminase large subunit-like protein
MDGWLTTTPGASVEYKVVAERLIAICDDYDVARIAFDRWRIDVFKTALSDLGVNDLPMEPFGQGYKDMSPALDTFESEMLNGKLRHGENPILTWCAANSVATSDPAGNRKLDKKKANGRIDGLVALVMAMGQSMTIQDPQIQPGIEMW